VCWNYFDKSGEEQSDYGVYFICDGGYMRWPELICPYKHEPVSSVKSYFSVKIESIRKDVECVFGILKKRWRILDYGIQFRNIHLVEKVFVVCCMLHNNMLLEMESTDSDAVLDVVGQLMEMVFGSGETTASLEWRTIDYEQRYGVNEGHSLLNISSIVLNKQIDNSLVS
jgi:hypothetical protein